MTSEQYQDEFNRLGQQGFRPVRVSGWGVGPTSHYAAIWVKREGPAWVARHGLLSDSYQELFNYLARDGYRLSCISGYHPDVP